MHLGMQHRGPESAKVMSAAARLGTDSVKHQSGTEHCLEREELGTGGKNGYPLSFISFLLAMYCHGN